MFKRGGEEKQRFSIRKYSTGVFSSLVGIALLMLGTAQNVLADHKVTYDHVDFNDLSDADKAQVRAGIPSGKISADEEILLVYRGVNKQTPPPKTPEDTKKPKTPEKVVILFWLSQF